MNGKIYKRDYSKIIKSLKSHKTHSKNIIFVIDEASLELLSECD